MFKKINIIEKEIIDFSKLLKYSEKTKYFIMNYWTYCQLFKQKGWKECWNEDGISYTEFQDIPVAICDKLNNGMVEIV